MSQVTVPAIDPNSEDGTELAGHFDGLKSNLYSHHLGASRPTYAVDGMIWTKDVSPTVRQIFYFDGTNDILIGTIDPTADTFTPTGVPSAVPAGALIAYAGAGAPAGWLLCYGQLVSRTTYSALFAAIGTTFGVGDGSTTFGLPDLRGRVAAGIDNMGGGAAGRLTNTAMAPDGNTLGAVGGSQTHTLSTAEMPAHTHTIASRSGPSAFGSGAKANSNNTGSSVNDPTSASGSGAAHNNTQPTMLLNYLIKT